MGLDQGVTFVALGCHILFGLQKVHIGLRSFVDFILRTLKNISNPKANNVKAGRKINNFEVADQGVGLHCSASQPCKDRQK